MTRVPLLAGLLASSLAVTACSGSASSVSSASRAASLEAHAPPAPPAPRRQSVHTLRLPRLPSGGSPARTPRPPLPLAGKVVGIDPGHNGRNFTDPTYLNHPIWNGRTQEGCDTTGAQTAGGYSEAQFNFAVARYLTAELRAAGAKVVLTRQTNHGLGPCVDRRAEIINQAHADVAIDIHADGAPSDERGFAILEPVTDGPNNRVIAASETFGLDLLRRYRAITHMPLSTYDGVRGISFRNDLAGLNLTRVPKVLIECGNMPNPTDAGLLVRPSFQKLAARSFTQAISDFLTHPPLAARHRAQNAAPTPR